jgi:hypothetical protein
MSRLKVLATRRGTSLAELVREGVDAVLARHDSSADSSEERKQRALRAVGLFRSGLGDLAEEHDRYVFQVDDE